jgi:2-dehydro-3-deoxygluconokinase
MPKSPEVVSYGEPLIGIYPPEGHSIAEDQLLSKTWGGDTSNFALALSKLGHRTAYLTRIGSEDFGSSFIDIWRQGGVDLSLVQRDSENPTGLYFISFEGKKHNFTYYRRNSAACFIDAESIDWQLLLQARVLHLSGISQGISGNALEVSFKLMDYAKANGILISYDVNFRPPIWHREVARAVILHTINEYADILEVTEDELELLGWKADSFFHDLNRVPGLVALKRGSKGCILMQRTRKIEIPSYTVEVADTVGAGDAFDAGLIAGVLENLDLKSIGRKANAVAALTCRGIGPLRAHPDPTEVESLLSKADPGLKSDA